MRFETARGGKRYFRSMTTTTADVPAVRVEQVQKSFVLGSAAVGALRGIDLRVAKGEFVALMGPSGCGKTTLLNLVGGIDLPSKGAIWIEGVELSRLSDDALTDLRRDRLGYVFQFYNLIPTLTARENVETPMQFRGLGRTQRRERALALLGRVGLADRADHKPAELSGGEQQRVAIARALANDPVLVLLDEPTGDLDQQTGREVLALLQKLNQEEKVTLLVATHDPAVAAVCSRVVRIRDGKLDAS
jgi:putative ABC transport system ATP-binding protein